MADIEQEFFKVFGVEPNCAYLFLLEGEGENEAARILSFRCKADLKNFIVNCGGKGRVIKTTNSPHIYYPEITDRKLLEMICIHNSNCKYADDLYTPVEFGYVKEEVLEKLVSIQKSPDEVYYCEDNHEVKQQVQSLFREGEE